MQLEQLLPFCSIDPCRHAITAPFTADGYTYATDGKIIIQTKEIPGAMENKLKTDPSTLIPRGTDFLPVTYPPAWETFTATSTNCSHCRSHGKFGKCPGCDGEGECYHCHHTCDDCDGSGLTPAMNGHKQCDECNGTGKKITPYYVGLNQGKLAVDLKYLKLLHTLPDAQLFHQVSQQDKIHQSLLITFTGGIGVLMSASATNNASIPLTAQWPTSSTEH